MKVIRHWKKSPLKSMCMSMEGYGVDVTICRDLKRQVCNACDKVAGRTGGYVAVGLT
jgi:RNase P subunit RPR2